MKNIPNQNNKSKIDDLHSQFTEYGKNAKLWMRKCVLLLPEIAKNRVWEKKNFGSIYEYAAKLAGMSREKVDDALWILKKVEDKPTLRKVAEKKGINAIRPIVSIATKENEEFWAEKAEEMSQHTLRTYKKEYLRNFRVDPNTEKAAKHHVLNLTEMRKCADEENKKTAIWMEIDEEIAEELKKWKGDGDWNELMKEFIKLKKEKLDSEKPEPVEAASRHIPAKIEKFVAKRSAETCEFPGCTKKTKILHHTDRFAISQTHDPDKIRALCKEHEHLAHHGLIENEEKSPNTWKIKKYAYGDDPKCANENSRFYEFTPKFEIDNVVIKKRNFP